jgi:CRISPR-associated protein Csd2
MPDPQDHNNEEPEVDASAEDVATRPASNADSQESIDEHISAEVRALYDVYSYRHAAAILATSFPDELAEIERALLAFRMSTADIGAPGGNESVIPKKFSHSLRPAGWVEARVQGDLLVRMQEYDEELLPNGSLRKIKRSDVTVRQIDNFIDGHKIDYVKGRVAFDVEWNSKDQTFDRDLYALRAFHECGLTSAGVLVTRSASLNPIFAKVPQLRRDGSPELFPTGPRAGQPKTVRAKYGASTTWMGKLLYRLNAGRHGGCPVLVFGITPALISDWNPP